MISQDSLRRLDFYFTEDHRARAITFLILSASGLLAFFISSQHGFSERHSIIITSVVVVLTLCLRLRIYLSFYERSPRLLFPDFFYDRRFVLLRGLLLVASFLTLNFLPKRSYASELNRKILSLVADGRTSEATAIAKSGLRNGVPLDVDVIPLTGVVSEDPQSIPTLPRDPNLRNRSSAVVTLRGGRTAEVRIPVVGYPQPAEKTGYMVSGVITNPGISEFGIGSSRARLIVLGLVSVLFENKPTDLDVLFSRFEILYSGPNITSEEFISSPQQKGRIIVNDVQIKNLSQHLDRVDWIEVTFEHCAVSLQGDWFELESVIFRDCQFEFADQIPQNIRETLSKSAGGPISLHYRAR
jgi:hypothetical protein